MRKLKLSASIMCANLLNLEADLRVLSLKGLDYLHFDIMDGHFVPGIGLGIFMLEQIARAQQLPMDVHLMVTDPERYISPLIDAGSNLICIHQETGKPPRGILERIKKSGAKTGVALRPETPIGSIAGLLDVLDMVLLMAYAPGVRFQRASEQTNQRITELCGLLDGNGMGSIDVAIDGGVSLDNMRTYRDLGANFFILGSTALFVPHSDLGGQVDRIDRILDRQG